MTIAFYAYNENQDMLRTVEHLFNKTIRKWYNIEGAHCEYSKSYIIMTVDIKPEHAWPMKEEFNRRLMRNNEWNVSDSYEFEWTV